MFKKNLKKIKLRKIKRVKDEKKAAERERVMPRNRQVQNYYTKKPKKTIKLKILKLNEKNFKKFSLQ